MATITGFTAQRMLEMEDATVVDGNIVGDDLILSTKDGTLINAGNVRGPMGPVGNLPTGTIIMGGWNVNPIGYLMLDGSYILGGAITYGVLALCYPDWVVNTNDMQLPNTTGVVPMGGNIPGIVSGSMTHTLTSESQLPSHNHTAPDHRHNMQHGHTHNIGGSIGNHQHPAEQYQLNDNTSPYKFYSRIGSSGSNYDWFDPQTVGQGRTQWAAYTYLPTAPAGAQTVAMSGGVFDTTTTNTGYMGTGLVTGFKGASASINHTPKNITVRLAVKT